MHRSWLIALGLLAAGFLAAPGSAAPADVHVTLTATEGPDCDPTTAEAACFIVSNGSLSDLPAGGTVHLMLENTGQLDHNAFVTDAANADENNLDTAGDDAVASTDTVSAGGNTSVTFTVPSDADELYIWCDIQGHEPLGMFMTASVGPAVSDGGDGADGGDDDGSEGDDANPLPAPGALALAGAAGIAVLAEARRRG